jgi:hypothetical protein
MRKLTTILLSIAVLMIALCTSAFAQTQAQILSVAQVSNNDTNVTYSNGTLTLTVYEPTATAADPFAHITGVYPTTVQFTPLVETGFSPALLPGSNPQEFFSGGTFAVTGPGGPLLDGAFTGAVLTPGPGGGSGTIQLADTTLTGGAFIPAGADVLNLLGFNAGTITFTTTGGTLVAPNAIGPLATGFNSFTGHDAFEVSTVVTGTPEPASYATFGIGALALFGLIAVAKRRSLRASL